MLCHVKRYATSVTFECRSFVIISIETQNNLDYARAWCDPGMLVCFAYNISKMVNITWSHSRTGECNEIALL